MNSLTRRLTLATSVAVAAPLLLAAPAMAAGSSHGGGGWTCSAPTTQTLPGITTKQTFPVLDAGKVTLKRDTVNDGLIVSRAVANAGYTKTVEIAAGPKVAVKFQQDSHHKVEFEAAQSAQYYGPDILVTETKTCSR